LTPPVGSLCFELDLFPVATSTYGFPKHDLSAAIAAADDLARRYRDGSTRRLLPDGSVDLAAMEGWFRRRFLLYRVSPDGTAALVGTTPAPTGYTFALAMLVIGGATFAVSVVTAIVREDAADQVMALGILGFIVCFVGVIRSNRFGLTWYVRETFGGDSDWQQLFGPTEWAPRSVEQLRAVEQLADEHGGKAFGRPHPDGGTEVRTLKRGRLHTHVAAPDGTVFLTQRSKPSPLYVLGVAAMAIGAAGGIVAILLYNLTDLHIEPAWYVSLGLLFGGATLRGFVRLESRVKDRASGAWHLVQTKPDDTD
jgi:hypothetical protein